MHGQSLSGSRFFVVCGVVSLQWCVTLDTSGQLCVCGINRMTTQRVRGGGCVCFQNTELHGLLNKSIATSWSC
jgi:hypothetical protein